MNKQNKNDLDHCLCENDDYFFRDNEMYRTNLDNIEHQVDPTFHKDKNENERNKKKHH